jgi:hypothetical protein
MAIRIYMCFFVLMFSKKKIQIIRTQNQPKDLRIYKGVLSFKTYWLYYSNTLCVCANGDLN